MSKLLGLPIDTIKLFFDEVISLDDAIFSCLAHEKPDSVESGASTRLSFRSLHRGGANASPASVTEDAILPAGSDAGA